MPGTSPGAMEDPESSPRVLGIGIGLFLIILVWTAAISVLVLVSRMASGASVVALGLAALVTAVLVAVPRHPPALPGQGKPDYLYRFTRFNYVCPSPVQNKLMIHRLYTSMTI